MTLKQSISKSAFIHPTADVAAAAVGQQTRILQYSVIQDGVTVGEYCQIDPFCIIGRGVVIGDRVSICGGVNVAAGVEIRDDVVIGPNCAISGVDPGGSATAIRAGAALGANVTVLAGVDVGQYSRIEDGSVVRSNVPPGTTVVGNPAVMHEGPVPTKDILRFRHPEQPAIAGVQFLSFEEIQDLRGTLTICQWNRQLPFVPSRVFFIHGVPNENVRGAHAHKQCVQALVCFQGNVHVLLDDGEVREEYVLDSSGTGLVIPAGVWATQYHYSANALLVVFASHDYDAHDYIRNYEDFLAYRRTALDPAA